MPLLSVTFLFRARHAQTFTFVATGKMAIAPFWFMIYEVPMQPRPKMQYSESHSLPLVVVTVILALWQKRQVKVA